MPGRRWTFLARTSIRSNWWPRQWTSRAVKRTWPYWPMTRARSEPSTEMSVSTMVSSCPENRIVRRFPTSQARAASTIAPNGSPGRKPGWGRPSDWAAAEDMFRTSVQFRFSSSAQDRSNGHQSAMATC